MKSIQKIFVLFVIMVLGLALRGFAAVDQSKVVNLDNATYNIEYIKNQGNEAYLYIEGFNNYSEDYKYIMILTNNISEEPIVSYNSEEREYVSNIGLRRNILFTSNDSYDVPEGKALVPMIEKVVELNGDIRAWIYACEPDSTDAPELVKGNVLLSRPTLPNYMERMSGPLFYNNISINIPMDVPRDIWTKRKMRIVIGEVKDYNLLVKIKENGNAASDDLYRYAKSNKNVVVNTMVETPGKSDGTYFVGYECDDDIPESLNLKDKITQNKYYYIYAVLDGENGKFVETDGVYLLQSENSISGRWGLHRLGSMNFDWNNLDDYKNISNDENNVIPEENNVIINNVVDNTVENNTTTNNINNIVNNGTINNSIDNSVSDTELPYTGFEMTALYLVFVLLCVMYRKYKKIKNVK